MKRYLWLVVGGFFEFVLILGLSVVRDYGVSTDERVSRLTGQVSPLYLFQRLPLTLQQRFLGSADNAQTAGKSKGYQLAAYVDRDYGVAFELPVTAAEQVLHLHDGAIYVFRHYCTFLVSFAGVIGFFYLARSGLLTGKLDYWVRYSYCHCLEGPMFGPRLKFRTL